METRVYDIKGKEKGKVSLPTQFSEPVRVDLIRRGFLAFNSKNKQAYGADPEAGTRQGKATPKRRGKYGTTYGHGISRVKRKTLSSSGIRFYRMAAFIANAVGGRKAHPPKSIKKYAENINKKEKRKIIRSAISATHFDDYPLIIEDKLESLSKTKDVNELLSSLKLSEIVNSGKSRKVKKGKGKKRGRRYKSKKSILFVVSKPCSLMKSARNIAGSDVSTVRNLNMNILAPGGNPGRVTVWSKAAIESLEKDKLYL